MQRPTHPPTPPLPPRSLSSRNLAIQVTCLMLNYITIYLQFTKQCKEKYDTGRLSGLGKMDCRKHPFCVTFLYKVIRIQSSRARVRICVVTAKTSWALTQIHFYIGFPFLKSLTIRVNCENAGNVHLMLHLMFIVISIVGSSDKRLENTAKGSNHRWHSQCTKYFVIYKCARKFYCRTNINGINIGSPYSHNW